MKHGDKVKVHYTGTLNDGNVFDSSEGKEPLEFTIGSNQVIPGFENGIKEMTQINSLKPKAMIKETIKICFRLFRPNNSPARRLTKNPFQNIKSENNPKTMKPAMKLTVWAKIKNQIIPAARNTKIGDMNKKIFGEIFIILQNHSQFF